jgi:hypothetical protein
VTREEQRAPSPAPYKEVTPTPPLPKASSVSPPEHHRTPLTASTAPPISTRGDGQVQQQDPLYRLAPADAAAAGESVVPAGHVAVCVGGAAHLNHPVFRELLRQAEEEYGFPCDEGLFEHLLPVPVRHARGHQERRARRLLRRRRRGAPAPPPRHRRGQGRVVKAKPHCAYACDFSFFLFPALAPSHFHSRGAETRRKPTKQEE